VVFTLDDIMAIKLIFKCLHILSCECEFVISMLTHDNSQLNFHGGNTTASKITIRCRLRIFCGAHFWEFRVAPSISHNPIVS
jgi:hypothetical protein